MGLRSIRRASSGEGIVLQKNILTSLGEVDARRNSRIQGPSGRAPTSLVDDSSFTCQLPREHQVHTNGKATCTFCRSWFKHTHTHIYKQDTIQQETFKCRPACAAHVGNLARAFLMFLKNSCRFIRKSCAFPSTACIYFTSCLTQVH